MPPEDDPDEDLLEESFRQYKKLKGIIDRAQSAMSRIEAEEWLSQIADRSATFFLADLEIALRDAMEAILTARTILAETNELVS